MRLLVVRHAPSAVSGVCYGQSDVPIAMGHVEAAEAVANELGSTSFEGIVTSPYDRTRGLALEIARRTGRSAPRVDDRISELSFGSWEGRTFDEIEANDPARLRAWMERYTELAAPGGETVGDLDARVRAFVADMQTRAPNPVLIVTHAGVVRALRRLRYGTSWEEEMSAAVPHLKVTSFEFAT